MLKSRINALKVLVLFDKLAYFSFPFRKLFSYLLCSNNRFWHARFDPQLGFLFYIFIIFISSRKRTKIEIHMAGCFVRVALVTIPTSLCLRKSLLEKLLNALVVSSTHTGNNGTLPSFVIALKGRPSKLHKRQPNLTVDLSAPDPTAL